MSGPLADIRIVDLSRVLAGPVATQMLGDLGADVLKIERPQVGDDTRRWGPPYHKGEDGGETSESAYYLSANRNKRSVAIDFSKPEGAALVRRLLDGADVLVENFKVGDLKRHGLDHESLKADFPGLIYCSITGYGQDGPLAGRPGYDYMAQAISGLMSVTGPPDGEPTRVGVAISDILTGMYAASSILAALHHRDRTGRGQAIDLALIDCQVAGLANMGQYHLTSGETPPRFGNAHANIVPYDTIATSDGWVVIAIGNDAQFGRLCELLEQPALARDPRFATNDGRVRNRGVLLPILADFFAAKPTRHWAEGGAERGLPITPINSVPEAFANPQVRHREMKISMTHPLGGPPLKLIGSPVKLSETPVSYRRPPPTLGQHTGEVLGEILGLSGDEVAALKERGVL